MSQAKKFYVYVIRDPRPGKCNAPIYVGKGSGKRAYRHLFPSVDAGRALGRIIMKCRKLGIKPIVDIAAQFSDEKDALCHEIKLIAIYGRRSIGTGVLCNLTDGGEGASGWIPPKTFGRAISARMIERHKRDPHYRKAITTGWQKWWTDKTVQNEWTERLTTQSRTAQRRARSSAVAKTNWSSVKYREIMRIANEKVNSDPALAAWRAENCRQRNADVAFQKDIQRKRRTWLDSQSTRKAMKEHYVKNSKAILAGVINYWSKPENRAKQSERMRLRNLDPKHQALCQSGRTKL